LSFIESENILEHCHKALPEELSPTQRRAAQILIFYSREICFNGVPLLPTPKCLKWFLCFRVSDYDIPISCIPATCSASLLYHPKSNIHGALQISGSSFSLRPYLLLSKFLSTQNWEWNFVIRKVIPCVL